MSDHVVVFGSEGSMGRRYQAIFRHLGVPVIPVDKEPSGISWPAVDHAVEHSRGIVIATPTSTHVGLLERYLACAQPILCEKPIIGDGARLQWLGEYLTTRRRGPFTMMCQYQECNPPICTSGTVQAAPTEYDYFYPGNDGLAWDCISLIALARGPIRLRRESPIWRCVLNGRHLTLGQVNQAYVDFIARWLKEPVCQDREWLIDAHRKAATWEEAS